MHKTLEIAKQEFKTNVKRKGYLLFTIVLPALFLIGVSGLAFLGPDVPKEIVMQRALMAPIPLPIIIPSILGAIFSLAIFLSSGFLLYGIIEEKENRLIEILLTSVSPRQLLVGKILGLGAMGIIQLTIWIISCVTATIIFPDLLWMAFMDSISLIQIIQIIIFFVAGYFLFAIILAGAGSMLTDTREASPISGAITTLSLIPSWAAIFFFADPNSGTATLFSYFPITGPTTMAIRTLMTEIPVHEIIISIAITIATIALLVFIVEKNLKNNLLAYEKRSTPKK